VKSAYGGGQGGFPSQSEFRQILYISGHGTLKSGASAMRRFLVIICMILRLFMVVLLIIYIRMYIHNLSDIKPGELALYGGKAASLAS